MLGQNQENGSNRFTIIVVVIIAVIAALGVGGVAMMGGFEPPPPPPPKPQGLPNAKRAGDPLFDQYGIGVKLDEKKFYLQQNMLGQRQAIATGKIRNFTDKTMVGVELIGKVLGKEEKLLASTIDAPVPTKVASIPPGGSANYKVMIDGIPKDDEIDDITIEVHGIVVEE